LDHGFFFKFLNLKTSSAGKRTARFLLAAACDSYVPLRSLRSLRWLETPLYTRQTD